MENKKIALEYLNKNFIENINMIEAIRRGRAKLISTTNKGVFLLETKSEVHMLSVDNQDEGIKHLDGVKEVEIICINQSFMRDYIKDNYGLENQEKCLQVAYLKNEKFKIDTDLVIRNLKDEETEFIVNRYDKEDPEMIRDLIRDGEVYGGFTGEKLVGYIGSHAEGSMGILEILPEYRRNGYGEILVKHLINEELRKGRVPYGHILTDNEASIAMQRKLGFSFSKEILSWLY